MGGGGMGGGIGGGMGGFGLLSTSASTPTSRVETSNPASGGIGLIGTSTPLSTGGGGTSVPASLQHGIGPSRPTSMASRTAVTSVIETASFAEASTPVSLAVTVPAHADAPSAIATTVPRTKAGVRGIGVSGLPVFEPDRTRVVRGSDLRDFNEASEGRDDNTPRAELLRPPTALLYRQRVTKPRRTVAQLVPAIRRAGLMGTMALSVAFVATLALWDETRESSAALEDFAQDQVTLAKIAAAELSAQLSVVRRDALIASVNHSVGRETPTGLFADYVSVHVRQNSEAAADPPHDERAFLLTVPMADATRSVDVVVPIRFLVAGVSQLERANTVLSLIVPPSTQRFHTARDHLADEGFIAEALDEGREVVFLDREEAARLELPVGPAVAAFARVDAGSLGQWGVAVVASAGRERDREIRARWRLVLGVLLAGGLVLVFGGFALRARRHELELERTLAIAELQQARDAQLGRENRAATMVTLAAGVAHEVSSPLSVIVGRAENLLERGGDEKSTRGLQSILEQADRIRQVIRDFLRLARGDVPMLDRVEPRAVAEGAIRLVEHRFSNAEVLISAEIADDLPMIRGDQHLLEQALVNLLLNACDACQPGGHVAIAVSADASDVTFKITDDGSGITPANAARVLEPFFSTKPVEQGTGLGLAIASEILKIHRGSLTLTARDPRGTEACVRVPNSPRGADAAA